MVSDQHHQALYPTPVDIHAGVFNVTENDSTNTLDQRLLRGIGATGDTQSYLANVTALVGVRYINLRTAGQCVHARPHSYLEEDVLLYITCSSYI